MAGRIIVQQHDRLDTLDQKDRGIGLTEVELQEFQGLQGSSILPAGSEIGKNVCTHGVSLQTDCVYCSGVGYPHSLSQIKVPEKSEIDFGILHGLGGGASQFSQGFIDAFPIPTGDVKEKGPPSLEEQRMALMTGKKILSSKLFE